MSVSGKDHGGYTHGHCVNGKRSAEHRAWSDMKSRCHNPNSQGFKHYGRRGIKVCARWRESFAAFLEDIGPRPDGFTLGRINNDGNYEPGNVRWESWAEQAINRRSTRWVEWQGERVCLKALCDRLGVDYKRVIQRIDVYGYSLKDALTKPVVRGAKHEYMGMRLTVAEWSRLTGLSRNKVRKRIRRGWPIDRALEFWTPPTKTVTRGKLVQLTLWPRSQESEAQSEKPQRATQ